MDNRRLTIAVDFDGVIADYDGWKEVKTWVHRDRTLLKRCASFDLKGEKLLFIALAEQKRSRHI